MHLFLLKFHNSIMNLIPSSGVGAMPKSIQVRKIAPEGLANISGQFLSGCLFLLMRSHIKKKPDDSLDPEKMDVSDGGKRQ